MQTQTTPAKTGIRVSFISIIASVILSALKLATGIIGHSSAMVSDAVNSISDIATYSVVMGGVAASDKRADSHHQYGHDKIESIVSVLLAIGILITGVLIGWDGVTHIMHPEMIVIPTTLPLVGAVVSILVKFFLWRFTRTSARKSGLNSLEALATDHLSDVFASTGTLVGVLGARLGFPVLDTIASMLIALLIIKSSLDIFKSAANVLLDISVDKETLKSLEKAITANPQVKNIDLLRTRSVGARYYVEVEIHCCRNLSLHAAHDIAEEVHDRIEQEFPKVKHVMVHTNPCTGNEPFCTHCQIK